MDKDSTSGESGVDWHKKAHKWRVRVWKDGRLAFYQLVSDKGEAIQLARKMRREIHGEFVRPVFGCHAGQSHSLHAA